MRQLMLLRHAKTEKDSPTGNDRDRRLNTRGREDAPAIGRYIADHELAPQLVLVSPAVRARETSDLVAAELAIEAPHEIVPDLYGADPSELLKVVRSAARSAARRTPERVMIVGHNPGLHEFALALVKTGDAKSRRALQENLPTGGLVIVSFSITQWADLTFGGGRLERLVSPALLRQESDES